MTSMADIVVGAVAAVIGTPQRARLRPVSGISPPDLGDEAGEQAGVESPPSPEAFGIGTPAREEQAAPPSEAGSAGSHLSTVEALQGRLDAANESISRLNLQLGEARAQLAAAMELREMAVRVAVMETKLAAQTEIKELTNVISTMKLDWAQWEARMAAVDMTMPEAELPMEAPGLGESATSAPSQPTSAPGDLSTTPAASTHAPAASAHVPAVLEETDRMPDAWALARAQAVGAGSEAGTVPLETRYPVQVVQGREATDAQHAPLRDLHPKDVPPPAHYKGDSARGSSGAQSSADMRCPAAIAASRSSSRRSNCCEAIRSRRATRLDGSGTST